MLIVVFSMVTFLVTVVCSDLYFGATSIGTERIHGKCALKSLTGTTLTSCNTTTQMSHNRATNRVDFTCNLKFAGLAVYRDGHWGHTSCLSMF